MQCVRMLCASHRCVLNICNTVASCTAPGKTLKDAVYFKRAKSLLNLNLRRSLCSCSSVRKCWSCGSSAQLFFCSSCNTIQPPHEKATYFEILNCDQTFALDTQKLQGKYIELQRSLHPDNFSQKSQLQLRGVELDEGTDSAADPALLLKVMEVNEKLAETQSLDEVNAVGQEVQVTLKNLTEQMNSSLNKGDLQSAREILAQMKYFANLEEKVKEKLRENL
ncbi:iron-sulfur cluster co-chaperone protein HscB isoform X2 [Hemibagrus wyckioides]|uniref:iron-sulfur cluster co-chaperone protein HscB isoform X2 n=1 Tax=Hemibagrus wyckioides TaxID=337641 RepID=UPI00266C01A9|nr:iron-sulfur cluster co-chaperone protein HscB isoform X2 [Hemibagrus wyckioides]